MPIFEFVCNNCDTVFEHITFSSSDTAAVTCSSCNSEDVKKILSATAFITKDPAPALATNTCQAKGGFT